MWNTIILYGQLKICCNSNFIGHTGDPGYEGFTIGTKGEDGERGDIIIKIYVIIEMLFLVLYMIKIL